ncbi:MAG: hypothetical protein EP298_03795 [Gammaproteobacteria bacterium]|nr:MAG: hypothetical protein EP298_03795 [Gammaproteobacteria bacterium]UTW43753.1 transposase [bacterium SCSIO 12844]
MGFNNSNGCVFEYNSSRSSYVIDKLEEYTGYIQTDVYSDYNPFIQTFNSAEKDQVHDLNT